MAKVVKEKKETKKSMKQKLKDAGCIEEGIAKENLEIGEKVKFDSKREEIEKTEPDKEEGVSALAVVCQKCKTEQVYNKENPFCEECGAKIKTTKQIKKELKQEKENKSKKRAELIARIDFLKADIEKREKIAAVSDAEGIKIAVDELKLIQNQSVSNDKFKEAQQALKDLITIENFRTYLKSQREICVKNQTEIDEISFRLDNFQLELGLDEEIEKKEQKSEEEKENLATDEEEKIDNLDNRKSDEKESDESEEKSLCSDCDSFVGNKCTAEGDICSKDEARDKDEF